MGIFEKIKKLGYTDPREEMLKRAAENRAKVEKQTKKVLKDIADIVGVWESEGGWVETHIADTYEHGRPYYYSGWLIFTNEDWKKRNMSRKVEVAFAFADGHETIFQSPTRNQIMNKIL